MVAGAAAGVSSHLLDKAAAGLYFVLNGRFL